MSTGLRLLLFECLTLLNPPQNGTRNGAVLLETEAAENSRKFRIMLCRGLRVFVCTTRTVSPLKAMNCANYRNVIVISLCLVSSRLFPLRCAPLYHCM